MLSGAGASIAPENEGVQMMNAMTQKQIGAQSMATTQQKQWAWLQKIIAGGGNFKMDKDKFSVGGESSVLKGMLSGGDSFDPLGSGVSPGGGVPASTIPNVAPTPSPVDPSVAMNLNPSISPPVFSGADLAGLSAQDVSQALAGATNVESLRQTTIANVANRFLKEKELIVDSAFKARQLAIAGREAATGERNAATAELKANQIDPLDKPFLSDVPGYGKLSLREYNTLPTSDKEFFTHVFAANQIGEVPLSREAFDKLKDKNSLPSTAMGAAIAGFVEETGTQPPPKLLAQWTEMFRDTPVQQRPLVTWTTATNEVTKRFGKLDPTGMWAVTPELQATHKKAQEFLVDLKGDGLEPLKAVNEAETKARKWMKDREARYFQYIKAAGNDSDKLDKIKSAFVEEFGYIPSQRR